MEVNDGIFTYTGRSGESDKIRPGAGSSVTTLIKGDGLTMIDTGVVVGGAFRELISAIEGDGLDIRDVDKVLITHSHWDHINASGIMVSEYGLTISAGEGEIPFIEDREKNFRAFIADFGEFAKEIFPFPMMVARFLLWFVWGKQPALRVDRGLKDGDIIEMGDMGRKIEVISIPGHTNGHTGYYLPDAGVMAIGDLIDFENAEGMDLNNPRSDYLSAISSIERLLKMDLEVIIPGHGEPIIGRKAVVELLQRALSGGHDYPGLIKAKIDKAPLRLKELTYKVFPDITFSMEAMTMMLVLKVLLYLEEKGEVERTKKSGRPAWILG